MKIIISIEHPAWAHQFKYIIKELQNKGHEVKVLAINKDRDLELLDAFNIDYEIISNYSGKNFFEKCFIFLNTTLNIFLICRKFKPNIFIGRASPMMAINSFIFQKPHVLFEDTEHSRFSLLICKLFSDVIITPSCFRKDLGKKQMRIDTYKELFYLHPKYFKSNSEVLNELGLVKTDRFIIVRFVAWEAHHDIGHSGLTLETKRRVIKEFEKFGRVFITSEKALSKEFESYRISLSIEKIHDLLNYATLLYGESSTMASECAVLGTHAIFCDFTGRGYTDEEELKYNLVYNFQLDKFSQERSINKGIELLKNPNLKQEGEKKRVKLLTDSIDINEFMVWFIENYPLSFSEMNENPNIMENFK